MGPYLVFVPIGCLLLWTVGLAEPPADLKKIRYMLGGEEFTEEGPQLIQMGEGVFPAYEAILSDPKAKPLEVMRIFLVLRHVKADRRRFVAEAIRRLMDSNRNVRAYAVELLGEIGTSAEASPVVALLSDEYRTAAFSAAKALETIGGEREVVAMDVWMLGVSHRDDGELRRHVKQCRDALKKRLDEARRATEKN